MSALFSPLQLRQLQLRNRIFLSPMCQYSAVDGVANDWHLVHLGSRASGGAGLVMVEATGVCAAGRITPGCLGLWTQAQAAALAPVARFIRAQGAAAGVQLNHAGRKASTDLPWQGGKFLTAAQGGWPTLGPSALAFAPGYTAPRALGTADIAAVVQQFATAAQHALSAGFDVVEIHMAHGYLLHEFLSPLSNQRRDDYGGSFANRSRLPLAVAAAVRAVWPADRPVFVRLSVTDWVDGGWDLEQSLRLAVELKNIGIDFIDCSSGGLTADAKIPVAPGYQVSFAAELRRQTGLATGAVGLITEPRQAEKIIADGAADAVSLGREFLRDPYWPLHAARALGVDLTWPQQYLRAKAWRG